MELQEIKNKLEDYLESNEENEEFSKYDFFEALTEGDTWVDPEDFTLLKEGGFKHLHQEGGGEGGAEHCECVFELFGKTLKGTYSYYSYHGHNYDYLIESLKEVQPKKVEVTVYE